MVSSLAGKYARALADVAAERHQSQQVARELIAFQALLTSHPELRDVLANPALALPAKRRVVESLASRMSLSSTVVNFVLVLLSNARLGLFDQVLEAYDALLDEQRGIVRGTVHSHLPIEDSTRERVEAAVSQSVNRKVKLTYHLDESLIGGLRIQVGSTVLDGSIKTQLEELRRRLGGQ